MTRRRVALPVVLLVNAIAVALLTPLAIGSASAATAGATVAAPAGTTAAAPPAKALQVVDRARAVGLFSTNESFSSTATDVDGDGDQDVWIGFHDQGGALYENDGTGRYTRFDTPAWGRRSAENMVVDRHDCAFADLDGDGLVDAYCGVGRDPDNHVKLRRDNELWAQKPAGVWTEIGTDRGVGDVCGRSYHIATLRVHGEDSLPSIYIGNGTPVADDSDPCDEPRRYTNEQSKLFLNRGNFGFFTNTAAGVSGENGGARCAETFDVNGDGRDDLLVCANPRPLLYVRNYVRSGFSEQSTERNLTQQYTDLAPGDMDGDGDPDLVGIQGRNVYLLTKVGPRFTRTKIATLPADVQGRRLAVGDADGDGRPDVYVVVVTNLSIRTNPDDVLLVRNPTGTGFTARSVPSAGGIGDEVTALDGNADGRSEFLVLNGADDARGPVQLISVTGSR